ncbi:MAG: RNA polymerase sigma factor [Pirellulales bacterium]|nr:RNA polymerase sigma factor [Pirellulales bacterium]
MSIGSIESDLLRQAVRGDRASLSQLFLLHYSSLQKHIASRISRDLGRLVDADDILHHTLLRAAGGIRSFQIRQEGSFPAWLKTIANNLIKDTAKRQRRERRMVDIPGLDRAPGPSNSWATFIEQFAGNATSPSVRTQKYENARHLRVALIALPDDYREVIERYYLQDQSFAQIAESMGGTKDSIRAMCYRARKRLRELMGQSSLYFSG